jgi:Ca2+-transporting ATPase
VLLMPVHIVLLELLIDPACSILFEAEPEAGDIMRRPPRDPATSPFARANLGYGIVQGIGLAAILLAGHRLLTEAGSAEAVARGAVFSALVAGVLLLTLANRVPAPATTRAVARRNPWLFRMIAALLLMLAAVFGVPLLRELMGVAMPDARALLAIAGMLVAGVAWLEGLRYARRHRGHAPAPPEEPA